MSYLRSLLSTEFRAISMNSSQETISRRRHAEVLVVLAGLVLMAYANSFGAGFTRDNRPLILDDPRVHSVSRQHLEEILTHDYWGSTFESGLYRPLTTLSFLLNRSEERRVGKECR